MKVTSTSNVGAPGGVVPARTAGGGQGFHIPNTDAVAGLSQTTRAEPVSGSMNVGSILALQGVVGPMERKRRAVRRAGRLLDLLDDVKVNLLSGEVSGDDLTRLRAAIHDERDATDDADLEGVLNEIETRAAVEMAKLECANNRG